MAIKTLYLTVQEANAILALESAWLEITNDEIKEDALLWGRYYIDGEYTCNVFDETAAPDEIKYANAYLALDYIVDGSLYDEEPESIKLKRVKAGSVETETRYSSPKTYRPKSLNKVDSLLGDICYRTSKAQGSSVTIQRR